MTLYERNYEDDFILAKKLIENDFPAFIKKKEGKWLRGKLVKVTPDFVLIRDNIHGDYPVFFVEMAKFEPTKVERVEHEPKVQEAKE